MQKDFNDSSKKLADLKEAEANSLGNTLGPLICGAPIDCSSQDGTIDGLEAKLVVLGKALRKLKQQFNAQLMATAPALIIFFGAQAAVGKVWGWLSRDVGARGAGE